LNKGDLASHKCNGNFDEGWSLVDRGVAKRYDEALQTMQDVSYGKWREYDPEDTIRFYALRLQEVGLIKSIPQKLIVQGTDWRFSTS
jgi:NitT/TauT family transport system substrate-binding protein